MFPSISTEVEYFELPSQDSTVRARIAVQYLNIADKGYPFVSRH